MTDALRLVEITPDNVLEACALRVRPEQEGFVAPVARSLAPAYATPDTAGPRLVYDGDRPVAFVMGFFGVRFDSDDPGDRPRSGLWRLAVSAGHQGRGYGRFAVEAVCEQVRRRGGSRVTVSWRPGEHGPEGFYLGLGFRPTGETSGDQVVAELDLGPAPAA
ncbi:GNAT family N-acetyltransferase [Streptomyces sp. Act-28]